MAKVVFFNIPAHGHVNPTLPLVTELVRRGEEIVYYNMEEWREPIEKTGAVFRPYPVTPELQALLPRTSGGEIADNMLAFAQVSELLLPYILDVLREEQPDYVIHDSLCLWARHACEVLNLPSVSSFAIFVFMLQALPKMSPLKIVQTGWSLLRREPAYQRIRQRVRRTYGVNAGSLVQVVHNPGRLNIMYTSADFHPNADKLGDSFRFVGPSLGNRPSSHDPLLQAVTRRPLIYISLGTINNERADFYQQCFRELADHPGQVILSVGRKTDISSLGAVPDHFIVRNFVPQLEVLQQADLFITHGGMNSVHEGLWYGVPMVVIPQQFEQSVVASQVERHGAGIALGTKPPYGHITESALQQAVSCVLADAAYKTSAERLGEGLRSAGGYPRAADEILAFAAQQSKVVVGG